MTEETTLRIERLIDAAPDVVFRAWTTREAMEAWYRDGDDFVARVTELDVRVGGRYRVEFGPKGQEPFVESGTYLEVEPPRRLVMSETLEGVEAPWRDTTVTIDFHAENGKTRFVLVHSGFATSHGRDLAAGGWPGFVDRVEALVTGSG